jgi:hypothetical protein
MRMIIVIAIVAMKRPDKDVEQEENDEPCKNGQADYFSIIGGKCMRKCMKKDISK